MTNYTIVEPHFEFIPPAETGKELEFLELCTRTSYKSEDKICPGSAEKLMNKVVREYEHLSVVEHQRFGVRTSRFLGALELAQIILFNNPLMSISWNDKGLLFSGNLRMWVDLYKELTPFIQDGRVDTTTKEAIYMFSQKFPIFNLSIPVIDRSDLVHEVDLNPLTNRDGLWKDEMLTHASLTYKLIGSRSMSHQLVRHRRMSFAQESQRYCNYGKKGFCFIVPPSVKKAGKEEAFIKTQLNSYQDYLDLLEAGVPPEDAREDLPNSTKTEVVTSGTLENWMHIFEHRADNPKAQEQIRNITLGIKEHMKGILPQLF